MISDFRIGIQCSDASGQEEFGVIRYTNWLSQYPTWSSWAMDANGYDPDAVRLILTKRAWPANMPQKDFRIGIQCADNRGMREKGVVQFTPWASEAVHSGEDGEEAMWSPFAADANQYDPDAFRIILLTRPWPDDKLGSAIQDVKVGIQMADNAGQSEFGEERYTPYLMEQHGGSSMWASDANSYDPDVIRICLLVSFRQT